MKINVKIIIAVIFAVIVWVGGSVQISAQDAEIKAVASGAKLKFKGLIASRSADSMIVRDQSGTGDVYVVELIPGTDVRKNGKFGVGKGKEYASSYLLRGLRIQVSGTGNAAGHLVADKISFDEDDLRTAQALQVTVDPVEAKTAENARKIEENAARIAAEEENAKKMAGQIDENTALANQAQATADRANNRINGLDQFDPIKTIVVPFAVGSSVIGPKGKAIIDEAAVWTKAQDKRGWVVAVVGFADSTGNTAKNKTLSDRRANAVIEYLVTKYDLPLTRLVQPFGAGVNQPAATNTTAAGRAQNRRVEIRLLVNRGIADK